MIPYICSMIQCHCDCTGSIQHLSTIIFMYITMPTGFFLGVWRRQTGRGFRRTGGLRRRYESRWLLFMVVLWLIVLSRHRSITGILIGEGIIVVQIIHIIHVTHAAGCQRSTGQAEQSSYLKINWMDVTQSHVYVCRAHASPQATCFSGYLCARANTRYALISIFILAANHWDSTGGWSQWTTQSVERHFLKTMSFACQHCSKSYAHRSGLSRHTSKEHKAEEQNRCTIVCRVCNSRYVSVYLTCVVTSMSIKKCCIL